MLKATCAKLRFSTAVGSPRRGYGALRALLQANGQWLGCAVLTGVAVACAGEGPNDSTPLDPSSTASQTTAPTDGNSTGVPNTSDTAGQTDQTAPTSTSTDTAASTSSDTSSEPAGPLAVPNEGRLLTRIQYDASVRDIFKGQLEGTFTDGFPTENEVMGFATDAHSHQASSWLVESHLLASEAVSAQVLAALATLLPCSATTRDAACAHAFLDEYGPRTFRRDLTAEELAPLNELIDEVLTTQGFEETIAMTVESLLQSPQFLYRVDFADDEESPGVFRVSDVEMATRLSYLFWNSIPDDELRERARSGQLHELADIEAQARRLAADPRTLSTLRDFTHQWLSLRKLDGLARQTPAGTASELNAAWKASLWEFATQSLWGPDGGVRNLMSSSRVYLTPQLAEIYGATVPEGTASDALFAAEFPGERFGLLTQPALMALLAHPDQTAPSQRGVFVREHILCQPPPAPPPTVNPTPPDPDPTLTTRERFLVHTQQPDCAGCHRMFDGIGMSFEGFDQAGLYRTEEKWPCRRRERRSLRHARQIDSR